MKHLLAINMEKDTSQIEHVGEQSFMAKNVSGDNGTIWGRAGNDHVL